MVSAAHCHRTGELEPPFNGKLLYLGHLLRRRELDYVGLVLDKKHFHI